VSADWTPQVGETVLWCGEMRLVVLAVDGGSAWCRKHVAVRPYDHERENPLKMALSLLIAQGRRSGTLAVQQAAAVVDAACREGYLVALAPTQRVVDTRHPSWIEGDPTPPHGLPREGA